MEDEFSVICGILISVDFMKKSRFSESQIVGILKESEGGIPVVDILRTHGIAKILSISGALNTAGLRHQSLNA